MKRLREQGDLSGAKLASRMNEYGVNWNRTTVAKFETGYRSSISVQELLALALALDVPPIWLLADVEGGSPTPISTTEPVDPWTALLWMSGRTPLTEEPGVWWLRIAPTLGRLSALAGAVEQLRRNRAAESYFTSGSEVAGFADSLDDLAARDRQVLRVVAEQLTEIQRSGLTLPPLPADIRSRAVELQFSLPEGG
ncbi:helix-turn-helix domain-containing protein [Pseudonocardia sp. McavD-2-B]|uniref:helix-turn-helix domain-containing protein n=1 Tax=Pseudonocardia sp. McavD-2-B TaxID=2954499 RepID=UPI0020973819|nr:helix-turn-helix domain-containing protein [Pseudonocardia sp. McavD-2-B]MCO7193960.1 helix-turn-helix domain-containing protein [Pseudonocardia sp. McavD-2-B]